MAPVRDSMDFEIMSSMTRPNIALVASGLAVIIFPILIWALCCCCDTEKKRAEGKIGEKKDGGGSTPSSEGNSKNEGHDDSKDAGTELGEVDLGLSPPPDLRYEGSSWSNKSSFGLGETMNSAMTKSKYDIPVPTKDRDYKSKHSEKPPTYRKKEKPKSTGSGTLVTSAITSGGQTSRLATSSVHKTAPSRKSFVETDMTSSKSQPSRGRTPDDLSSLPSESNLWRSR